MAVYKGAIAVNRGGSRLVDESLSYKLLGDACMAQPLHIAYQILDQEILESCDNSVPILDLMRRYEAGLFDSASTLEDLATRIKVPPRTLRQTVEHYNRSVDAGTDSDTWCISTVLCGASIGRLFTPIPRQPPYSAPIAASRSIEPCASSMSSARQSAACMPPARSWVACMAAYMTGSGLAKAAIFGRIAARSALEH
jgi:fumarate reductase flavoprotein subunit